MFSKKLQTEIPENLINACHRHKLQPFSVVEKMEFEMELVQKSLNDYLTMFPDFIRTIKRRLLAAQLTQKVSKPFDVFFIDFYFDESENPEEDSYFMTYKIAVIAQAKNGDCDNVRYSCAIIDYEQWEEIAEDIGNSDKYRFKVANELRKIAWLHFSVNSEDRFVFSHCNISKLMECAIIEELAINGDIDINNDGTDEAPLDAESDVVAFVQEGVERLLTQDPHLLQNLNKTLSPDEAGFALIGSIQDLNTKAKVFVRFNRCGCCNEITAEALDPRTTGTDDEKVEMLANGESDFVFKIDNKTGKTTLMESVEHFSAVSQNTNRKTIH